MKRNHCIAYDETLNLYLSIFVNLFFKFETQFLL